MNRRGSAERRGSGTARAGSGKAPELFTLGGVRLVRQGVDETSKLGPKHLALLVYLYQERRPMHPSEVTDLLGRGQDPGKETEGLNRAVAWLRENVPGVSIRLTGDTIEAFGGVTLDTREVDSAIDGGDARHVAELYVGEFLEGFESGSPAFDEWAQKERGRLKRAWNHAMLSAAREAERRRKWEAAADWWRVLVARAPMRPEAVAGLLGALADSGQTQEAVRAYADYTRRLKESGIAQPADAVKAVISRHKVLRAIAAGEIELPSEPVVADESAGAPPPEPEPAVPDIEVEPLDLEVTTPPEEPPASAAEPEIETVAGLEAGAPPPMPESPGGEAALESEGPEEAWEEIVDFTSTDDFDIPATPRPRDRAGMEFVTPEGERVVEEEQEFATKPRKREDDGALSGAREAAEAYGRTGRADAIRHQVTSVRKPWGPFLRGAWEELEPWRAKAKELAIAALNGLAAAVVTGLQLAGRGATAVGRKVWLALASLSVVGGRVKDVRRRGAETRAQRTEAKAELKAKRKAERAALKEAKREAQAEAKRRERQAKEEAERRGREAQQAALERAPPEPEVAEAAPWEEAAAWEEEETPPVPELGEAAPVEFEPPVEEVASPLEYAAPAAEVPLVDVAPPGKRRARRPLAAAGRTLRRYWYAPLVLAVVGLGVAFGPRLVGMVGAITGDMDAGLPDVDAPSLPRVNLPSVSIPRVTIRTPSFVETGVSRIAEMFSGPLLGESGQWLLLADVAIAGPEGRVSAAADGATGGALTQVLEADLRQARFFRIVPRERALVALRAEVGRPSEALPVGDALALAEAGGYRAVISGRVTRHAAVDSVRLQVFNPAGDTLYGVAAEVVAESNTLETLAGLTRAVRRRLGEPGEETQASLPPTQVLSTSTAALDAYAEARLHLFAGRYSQAIAAAQRAVGHDSTFALAHRRLAEAYALSGQRSAARAALESAWRFAGRLTDRERLRLLGDRHTWDGRLEEAILTYDDLFSQYRDDVGALKSQALVQRMIGVRGGGEGNLRVAYSIDPYDWPPLSRIARYLGYSGPLPDVDSLVAAVRASP